MLLNWPFDKETRATWVSSDSQEITLLHNDSVYSQDNKRKITKVNGKTGTLNWWLTVNGFLFSVFLSEVRTQEWERSRNIFPFSPTDDSFYAYQNFHLARRCEVLQCRFRQVALRFLQEIFLLQSSLIAVVAWRKDRIEINSTERGEK